MSVRDGNDETQPSTLDGLMRERQQAKDLELEARRKQIAVLQGLDTPSLRLLHCPKCGAAMVDPGKEIDTDYNTRL